MADDTKITNLVTKLCKIMAELPELQKTGENTFHKYKYIEEAEVVAKVRPLLAKYKIFIFHSVIEEVRLNDITVITVLYTFADGESGEQFSVKQKGYGADKQDKGLYKALTGCHKYFLLKQFHLASGDDPELETAKSSYEPPKQQTRPAAPKPYSKPTSDAPSLGRF